MNPERENAESIVWLIWAWILYPLSVAVAAFWFFSCTSFVSVASGFCPDWDPISYGQYPVPILVTVWRDLNVVFLLFVPIIFLITASVQHLRKKYKMSKTASKFSLIISIGVLISIFVCNFFFTH